MPLRILLVGAGGREHALAWKLAQSPLVSAIYMVGGENGGIYDLPKIVNEATLSANDFEKLVEFAVQKDVGLVVPGGETPLVNGIVDYFRDHGPARISCFGPSKAAARMEGSKAFSKQFMFRHSIPTAAYEVFTSHTDAEAYLKKNPNMKVVIKANGLAAGKGVVIPETHEEAVAAVRSMMIDLEFGDAADSIVIEEFLEGEELSVLSFSDGYTVRSLPGAQDHKRINDGDTGPNTGGMGCYAPTPLATPDLMDRLHRESLQPTIDGMRNEGYPFVGCLFTGFMLTPQGPKVLEYNVRFGDPECQTLLPLLESDLAEVMVTCVNHCLSSVDLKISAGFSTTVVAAAGGYPGSYVKGSEMTLKEPGKRTYIFHAGTRYDYSSQAFRTTGGRVIAATAIGSSITDSVERAYKGMSCIKFEKMHYRKDIAHRALKQQHKEPQSSKSKTAMTYASAGVSIEAGNSLVERIKPFVRSTSRPGCGSEIGGFGGEISLLSAGYTGQAPTLVMGIDGIGTKLMIAQAMNKFDTVGIDLVAMNVNDLIVQGAEPLAFVDYFACSKLDVDQAAAFVKGVAEGCVQANCGLVGGETAEMPGIYQTGDWDAAGCAVGAVAHDRKLLPLKDEMREGDVILGISSSGAHSNGFSLIRKIVERTGLSYQSAVPWSSEKEGVTLGNALLEPTKIYVKSILAVLSASDRTKDSGTTFIKGMAHITGGGLVENIPRMLPSNLSASIDVSSWQVPAVLKWLKKEGNLSNEEFARSFNTGLGMVVVTSESDAERVKSQLESAGEVVSKVGNLVARSQGDPGVILQNLDAWNNI